MSTPIGIFVTSILLLPRRYSIILQPLVDGQGLPNKVGTFISFVANQRDQARKQRSPAHYGTSTFEHGRRLQAVQERRAIRRVDRPDAASAFQWRQEQPGGHHQAWRHLPAHAADSGGQVGGADGAPDTISQWAVALRDRSGWQKAVAALANKNARILWAVMTRGDAFDANHVSVKPAGGWTRADHRQRPDNQLPCKT
jgi:hypothetical protein